MTKLTGKPAKVKPWARVTLPYDWQPRAYQMPAWQALEAGKKRVILLWHRRAGKDSLSLNWTACATQERVGLYWHVFPTYQQGRKILWNGFTKEGFKYTNYFPEILVKKTLDDEMMIELKNGSIWQIVGTDNVDRLVGANPIGVVMSEYALQNPAAWNLLRPILAENGGWAIFPYTPRSRNHGYELYKRAVENPNWFAQVLTVDDTQAIPASAIQEDRDSGMPEELIEQEYWCSFNAALVGSYYGDQIKRLHEDKRIGALPWDPHIPVYTGWDLGVGDSTAIWFAQIVGPEVRIIDYYENSGKGLEHYANVIKSKPYAYEQYGHFAPHDIMVREFGSGKSRIEIGRSLGLNFRVAPKLKLEDGIQAVRGLLPRCRFAQAKCERGVDALTQYMKEWDEELKTFSDKPKHDWTSHPADAFRTLAIGLRDKLNIGPLQAVAQGGYNLFGFDQPLPQAYADDRYQMFGGDYDVKSV